jgi:N-acetylneuraminate lyase
MYAVIKGVLRLNGGPDVGGVRKPLAALVPEDEEIVRACAADIREALATFCQ